EGWYEGNRGAVLGCVGLSAQGGPQPMMQLKVTALMSAWLCGGRVSLQLEEPGGRSELSTDRLAAVMGGEEANFSGLSPAENRHLQASLLRLDGVTQWAAKAGTRDLTVSPPAGGGGGGRWRRECGVLVDAEYTYVNPALTLVTLALMGRWNRTQPWVWNTYQCYLQDCLARLGADAALAERRGFWFRGEAGAWGLLGAGAAAGAGSGGYPDPLHPTWEGHQPQLRALPGPAAGAGGSGRAAVPANCGQPQRGLCEPHRPQDGGAGALPRTEGPCASGSCWACVTTSPWPWARLGTAIYKSIPYGAVEDVLPYLVRRGPGEPERAAGAPARSGDLLRQELWRRLQCRP
ncbi:unnamed protein product, partial [Eretmochelys imbricata]